MDSGGEAVSDRRFGAKPNPTPSPVAIVQHALTRRQRIAVARRDERFMRDLAERFDRAVIDEICVLCDRFASKHATWDEMYGDQR